MNPYWIRALSLPFAEAHSDSLCQPIASASQCTILRFSCQWPFFYFAHSACLIAARVDRNRLVLFNTSPCYFADHLSLLHFMLFDSDDIPPRVVGLFHDRKTVSLSLLCYSGVLVKLPLLGILSHVDLMRSFESFSQMCASDPILDPEAPISAVFSLLIILPIIQVAPYQLHPPFTPPLLPLITPWLQQRHNLSFIQK